MNEWTFASEVSKWWEAEAGRHPAWGLGAVRVEETTPGLKTRADLSVYSGGAVRTPMLTGELRLPDHAVPSPWDAGNLQDAVNKATTAGASWAFTSDASTLLLIDVRRSGAPLTRIVHRVALEPFATRGALDAPAFLAKVEAKWRGALGQLAPIVAGLVAPPGMAPDDLFINGLRALLAAPAAAVRDTLHARRLADAGFQTRLVEWMVDDQGWTHDPQRWDAEVALAANLTAYVFATRLLFYEALRRSKPVLRPLAVGARASARVAAAALKEQFEEAREVSGDYQTLFTWDRISEYALLDDGCVPLWARVTDQIGVFDVSALDYDVLGRLFERLIDPDERHRWGQHYTAPDVVDLMLSFGLPDGRGALLDPAAGGGTILVRGYVRKQVHQPAGTHQERLAELYGIDVSGFAATIATVNLAVRSLDFADNFPRVAPRSFFRADPGRPLLSLPGPVNAAGVREAVPVTLDQVAAVVGNPPYVKFATLGETRRAEARRVLGQHGRVATPRSVHGHSNYHVYFWLHAAQFLAPDGRLVFITSGEWLDSDYGVALQRWLLSHFAIEAFIESGREAWFSEARVSTVVTVARRCASRRERADTPVRFVFLRRTLRDLYGDAAVGTAGSPADAAGAADAAAHLGRVDALRDRILGLTGSGEANDFDWTVVRQGDLLEAGMRSRPPSAATQGGRRNAGGTPDVDDFDAAAEADVGDLSSLEAFGAALEMFPVAADRASTPDPASMDERSDGSDGARRPGGANA